MLVHGILSTLVAASFLAPGPDLAMGDPAPSLKIAEWVKGEAVDLSDLKGEKIAVVEFWATWCGPCKVSIPHLTKLQKEYADKGVVFIGVSSGEELDTVKKFVDEWDEKMGYTVAWDADKNATFKSWMDASGQRGIPTAFVVDKAGKIAWIGHPMGGLDEVLEGVVKGNFSIEKVRAKREAKAELHKKFSMAMETGDRKGLGKVVERLYESNYKSAASLNQYAWLLLTEEPGKWHFNEIALKMAERANDLTDGEDWAILDTLAFARFETGSTAEALKLEKKSIRLAKEHGVQGEQLGELQKALKRFKKAEGKAGRKFY